MAPTGPIVIKVDKKRNKKCIKCRQWKATETYVDDEGVEHKKSFGSHKGVADGYQVICYQCKGAAHTVRRNRNVAQRIRHHTGTRCLTQLGDLAPKGFVMQLETHLGYRIRALVKHLSKDLKAREGRKRKLVDALNEGYHIDHIKPLSKFEVIVDQNPHDIMSDDEGGVKVDWEAFRECWAMTNLRAISSEENLAKGAKHDVDDDEDTVASRHEDPHDDVDGADVEAPEAPKVNIDVTAEAES